MNTAVERFGGVNILLNNAGIEGLVESIVECPVDAFDQVMAVNVRGVWLGLKYALFPQWRNGAATASSLHPPLRGSPRWRDLHPM